MVLLAHSADAARTLLTVFKALLHRYTGKEDIVVVDTTRVVWYENPTWKRRTIIEGVTKPDNVCIAAHDIDGDGKLDFALGAEWKRAVYDPDYKHEISRREAGGSKNKGRGFAIHFL